MAYLRQDMQDKGQGAVPNLYSSGQGAEAGDDTEQKAATGQEKSTAGNAGGWYNIMDFIKGNAGDQSYAQGLQQKADDFVNKAKETGTQALSSVSTQDQTVPNVFSADSLTPEQAEKGLSQNYTAQNIYDPFKASQAEAEKTLGGIKSGSFADVAQFGATPQPTSVYNPQMRAMDEAILMQTPEFVSNFAGNLQNSYKSAINPLEEQAKASQAAEEKKAADVAAARQGWTTGITDYLKGKSTAVGSELEKQQRAINEFGQVKDAGIGPVEDAGDQMMIDQSGKLYDREVYNFAKNNGLSYDQASEMLGGKMSGQTATDASRLGVDLSQFLNKNTGLATESTAAGAALGGREGVAKFNALADMLAQYGGDQFNPYGYQEYKAPAASYDTESLTGLLKQGMSSWDQQQRAANALRAQQEAQAAKDKAALIARYKPAGTPEAEEPGRTGMQQASDFVSTYGMDPHMAANLAIDRELKKKTGKSRPEQAADVVTSKRFF